MSREKNIETCLVISTGLLIFYYITDIKLLILCAVIIGLIGAFINPLANAISWLWYKIAELMGFVSSKVILSIIFFLFLTPLALLYRLFNKDPLRLKKNNKKSYWIEKEQSFSAKDLENLW